MFAQQRHTKRNHFIHNKHRNERCENQEYESYQKVFGLIPKKAIDIIDKRANKANTENDPKNHCISVTKHSLLVLRLVFLESLQLVVLLVAVVAVVVEQQNL